MIDRSTVKSLSKIKSWRSILVIGGEWIFITIPLILLYSHWNWLFYIAIIFWIGGRQHGLGILMHDAAHYRLFNNRLINDIVSELFLAYPILVSTMVYRKNHLAHHHHLNTEDDPDWMAKASYEWVFPQSKNLFCKIIAKDFCGNYVLQILKRLRKKKTGTSFPSSNPGNKYFFSCLKLSYYGTLIFILTYFQLWVFFLLCWIVPLLTWNSVILKIRSIAEHFNLSHLPSELRTRTTIPTKLESLLVASHNVGYHTAHHLYPSVPYYNLPLIHKKLVEKGYPMHINHSYVEVVKDCIKQ